MNQPNQPNQHITTAVTCDKCKSEKFKHVFFIRRLSPLVSDDGKEHLIPIDVFECSGCGHINDSLNPLKIITK